MYIKCTSLATKRFPKAREMSRGQTLSPREILRSEGMFNPIHMRQCKAIRSSLIHIGMYQEMHPYRAIVIGSVKMNTSLLMMRKCKLR